MEGGENRRRKQKMRKIERQRVDPGGKRQQVETQKTMKKKKKHWINLRDKSQRWNHEKKLRDVRAFALFKKQLRREMHSGEHSEYGEAHSRTNFERDHEKEGGKKGSMNLSSAQAAGVANDHGYYASDPEDFLERLLNPFHSERKREKGETAAPKTGTAAAFAQRKGPEGRRTRDAAAGRTVAGKSAVEGDEDDSRRDTPQIEACAAEEDEGTYMHEKNNARKRSFRASSKEISTWKSDNCVRQGEKDENKDEETEGECGDEGEDEEEEEEEGEAAAHPEKYAGMEESEGDDSRLGEQKSTRTRGRRSRRLALYSPHSSATLEDLPVVLREKKKRRRATEDSRPESLHRKNPVLQEETSPDATAVEKKSTSEESPAVETRETRGTVVQTRRENGTDEKRELGADGNCVDRSTRKPSKELQVSLPKGVFYPFQHAMREAARRKAAQEEERKRRQEEREKAEKEKEHSRRRRAKQRRQLVARTSRGQPVMNNVVQVLLQKIKKSV